LINCAAKDGILDFVAAMLLPVDFTLQSLSSIWIFFRLELVSEVNALVKERVSLRFKLFLDGHVTFPVCGALI
jgi:hypothetical protein